jgi:endonuclease/exonuclease/phosphatase (EEP) superfamily protein YafD
MEAKPKQSNSFIQRVSIWYYIGLFSWFLLFNFLGDGNGYLGLANALALYFFIPLPLFLLIAWFRYSRVLLVAGVVGIGIFALLWGPLFVPKADVTEGPRLRVMTFNVLGRIGDPHDVLDSILAEGPDVLFLQEITPEFADTLLPALTPEYPHQMLDIKPQAGGMAVFSRFPIQAIDIELGGRWRGEPQLLNLDWEGQQITLVNFHTVSTGTVWPRGVFFTASRREESVDLLVSFAENTVEHTPLIMAGDGNLTRLNATHRELDTVLDDAWWESGFGLGHTFPGQIEADDLFTRISFFMIPHWLVRIDYVFYSEHWQSSRTWLAEFNGGSDHRGVVTELVLVAD